MKKRIIAAIITIALLTFLVFDVGAQPKKEMPIPGDRAAAPTPMTSYVLLGALALGGAGLVIYQYNWKKEN